MKQILLLTLLLPGIMININAQDTSKINLDLLRAPSSPGANLLGFSTSDIEKPSDVSAFMASLQTASSGFTKLPANYALDFAPFWLSRKAGGFTTASLNSQNFKDIFRQTFVLSAAIRNPDSADKKFDPKSTYAGLGFKFSIIRSDYNDKTRNTLESISFIQNMVTHGIDSAKKIAFKNDKEWVNKTKRMIQLEQSLSVAVINHPEYIILETEVSKIEKRIVDSLKNNENLFRGALPKLKALAADFKIERVGWFWDISGGSSLEFRNSTFNNSRMYNAGFWTSFGNNTEQGVSILGLLRYLYNPDKIYADDNNIVKKTNISTLDAGARIAFSGPESRFLFSCEAIYRSVLNKNTIDPSWKLALNAEYDIGRNQKLTFVFGRSFDGTITKDGNLIAALNLLTGFGNKR